jgi:hypothetical protein
MQSPQKERCSVLKYTFENGFCEVDIEDVEKLLLLSFKLVPEKKTKEAEREKSIKKQ